MTVVRPNVAETVQIGAETAAGTAVAANRRLGSLSFEAEPDIKNSTQKPTGYKYATVLNQETDATKLKIAGAPTYTEAPYPFSSAIRKATPTNPSAGVYRWLFDSLTGGSDIPQSFSLEQGNDALRASSAKYALITELSLDFSRRNGLKWGGSGIAQRFYDDKLRYLVIVGTGGTFDITVGANTASALAYNITAGALQTALEGLASVGSGNVVVSGGPGATAALRIFFTGDLKNTAMPAVSVDGASLIGAGAAATLGRMSPSPTEYPLVPINGGELDLYIASAHADLDTLEGAGTRFAGGFGGSWKLGSRWEGTYFIDSTQDSWSEHVEADPKGEMSLLMAAGDAGMGLLNNVRTGDTLFVRLKATGPIISSTDHYELQIDQALKVVSPGGKKVENQVVAYEFACEFAHDATWGKSYEVIVQNALSSL